MAAIAFVKMPSNWNGIGTPAWISLAYVTLFSMFLGFIFWYRGLALGGIASVGQLRLPQPFVGLMLAALFLHETIDWTMVASTVIVVFCVAGARRFT